MRRRDLGIRRPASARDGRPAGGVADRPVDVAGHDAAILATEYLAYSIQYRRLLMRFPLGPGPYRDRLLDAMASLLVDLHRAGVFWGDCSLANTLFRRDGDKIQAYLVDAETSEIHPSLSDGQRALRPRHPGRERRVRAGRPRGDAGPRGRLRGRGRGGRERAPALQGAVDGAPRRSRAATRDRQAIRGTDPTAQRSRVRGRRDQPRADGLGARRSTCASRSRTAASIRASWSG